MTPEEFANLPGWAQDKFRQLQSHTRNGFSAAETEQAAAVFSRLASQLDAKFVRWDCYRGMSGDWLVNGESHGSGHKDVNTAGPDLITAMQAAVDFVVLPRVPRRPTVYLANGFAPVKMPSGWGLQYAGEPWFGLCVATKKRAVEAGQKIAARSQADHAEWMDKHGWTLSKTEGVDFRWSD